jgi:sec-independent protein translocase protein TatA
MIEGLLQPQHLLIILAIALFVFGPKKLPELGKGLGQGIKQFKEGIKQATAESNHTVSTPTEPEKPNVVS